jgi:hypothetical protein
MSEVYLPLISALVEAIIGSASSIITMYIQTRVRDRRERMEQASRMAIESFKAQFELARLIQEPMGIQPLVTHFEYHWNLLQLLDSGEALNEEALRKLRDKNDAVHAAISKLGELGKAGGRTK